MAAFLYILYIVIRYCPVRLWCQISLQTDNKDGILSVNLGSMPSRGTRQLSEEVLEIRNQKDASQKKEFAVSSKQLKGETNIIAVQITVL